MNLNPRLNRTDRLASFVGGAGLATYAFLGDFDQMWVRAVLVVLGLMLVAGGVGGL